MDIEGIGTVLVMLWAAFLIVLAGGVVLALYERHFKAAICLFGIVILMATPLWSILIGDAILQKRISFLDGEWTIGCLDRKRYKEIKKQFQNSKLYNKALLNPLSEE